jgi:hypothetical protein
MSLGPEWKKRSAPASLTDLKFKKIPSPLKMGPGFWIICLAKIISD